MTKHKIPLYLRKPIYYAYDQRSRYKGEPISFTEIEIDLIIPKRVFLIMIALYNYWGYTFVNLEFVYFEFLYELDLNILVSSAGNYAYTSSGSTSLQLLSNFKAQVGEPVNYNGADIAIGVVYDNYNDPGDEAMGYGYVDGRHSIVLRRYYLIESDVICHEVGHNYGLYPYPEYHCPNGWCIMAEYWHPFISDFCDNCGNYIDKDKFRAPPGGGGGGGCPILYTFNGTEYIEEGLLVIHDIDGIDRTYIHTLQTAPYPLNNKINLQLTEHPKTISYIDHVRLYGRLENGQWVSLQLKSAIHSTIGEVKNQLKHSDDLRVTELGEEHNNGISETINLEFDMKGETDFLEFIFIIEGNNVIIK